MYAFLYVKNIFNGADGERIKTKYNLSLQLLFPSEVSIS